jgi:hypothetical protein
MAAKKTARELREDARVRYQQALAAARKVEEREKLALGDELRKAAEELGTEPAELLKRIKAAVPMPGTPEVKTAQEEDPDSSADEVERYSD